jgi:hypothetical protein
MTHKCTRGFSIQQARRLTKELPGWRKKALSRKTCQKQMKAALYLSDSF